jgi:3-vinyl bacteriochlorophyllide hydratase
MGVIALHTYYLYALLTGAIDTRQQMFVALAAYAIYVVNAIQFVLKLRAARLGAAARDPSAFESAARAGAV